MTHSAWSGRAGGTTSSEFEFARLADLHNRGVITDAEFEQQQQKIQP
jgi:Short C-terminal domain